jgi:ComF family protein
MLSKVDRWLSHFLPRHCLLCGLDSGHRSLCRGCRTDLPWLPRGCSRCAAPLLSSAPPGLCAACDLVLTAVDAYRAALVYAYPVDQLVVAAKFSRRPELARALGDLLALHLNAELPAQQRPDCLVPLPLHPWRLARRGFNQALEIALPVARSLDLPLSRHACRRARSTAAQTSLSGAARRRNPVGAFACHRSFAGLRVAVVDDVVTTGSSCNALAVALRAAGAARVEVWSAARVVSQPAWKL